MNFIDSSWSEDCDKNAGEINVWAGQSTQTLHITFWVRSKKLAATSINTIFCYSLLGPEKFVRHFMGNALTEIGAKLP